MSYNIKKRTTTTWFAHISNKIMVIASVVLLTTAVGRFASAKELTSGGTTTGGTTTNTCSPIKNLSYKGDARVGELGFGQISVNYSIAPCDKTVPVRVQLTLVESSNGFVFYDNTDLPLSANIDINGVKINTSFKATVTVYNATNGAVLGQQTIFAAARSKGV